MSYSISRADRLRVILNEIDANAMYVRDTPNIEWLTGFENVFDEERAHAAFVPTFGAGILLHTDSRYVTSLECEAEGTPVKVDAEAVKMAEWAFKKLVELGEGESKLAFEDSMSLYEYRLLEDPFGGTFNHTLFSTHNMILGLRAVKDEDEIKKLKAAQDITDASFSHIIEFIKPGMTEKEIQLELDGYMMRHGAQGLAFPTIIASGPNGASPHAQVSERKLEAGECVVMDFGAKRAGYCSDMTRTVFLGEPKGEMLDAWKALRKANETVEASIHPGVTGAEMHEMALGILAEGGFENRMGHGLGHGVGLEIHEEPVLSPRNQAPLVPGNVVTVEPGIYIPGKFGMRLEDFGVVTEDGFDVFTKSTHEPVIL